MKPPMVATATIAATKPMLAWPSRPGPPVSTAAPAMNVSSTRLFAELRRPRFRCRCSKPKSKPARFSPTGRWWSARTAGVARVWGQTHLVELQRKPPRRRQGEGRGDAAHVGPAVAETGELDGPGPPGVGSIQERRDVQLGAATVTADHRQTDRRGGRGKHAVAHRHRHVAASLAGEVGGRAFEGRRARSVEVDPPA